MSSHTAGAQRPSDGRALQPRRLTDRLEQLRRPVSHLGHHVGSMSQDAHRGRQSARLVRQILAQWQIHSCRHFRQVFYFSAFYLLA